MDLCTYSAKSSTLEGDILLVLSLFGLVCGHIGVVEDLNISRTFSGWEDCKEKIM
jgi:hypothetical protein